MCCIFNGVCSSLVALFLRQQVTNLAAVIVHCGMSPSRYGSLSKLDFFQILWVYVIWGKYASLWSYIWQEVRKCSSVSTSFCEQCAHSLSSLERQVYLLRPFSIARVCSLSLYIVKDFHNFGSVSHSGQVLCQCVHSSLLFFVNSFQCVK
jgi:hypothetical protein